jgi:hypothetical protein
VGRSPAGRGWHRFGRCREHTKSLIDLAKAFDQVPELQPKGCRFDVQRSELRRGDRLLHGSDNRQDGRNYRFSFVRRVVVRGRHRSERMRAVWLEIARIAALCRRAFCGFNMLFEFPADLLMIWNAAGKHT